MAKQTTKNQRVPVSERALRMRVSRRLKPKSMRLEMSRTTQSREQMGEYYLVNEKTRSITTDVSLEDYARDIGALEDWEKLEN